MQSYNRFTVYGRECPRTPLSPICYNDVDCHHLCNPQTGLSNYCILIAEYRRLPANNGKDYLAHHAPLQHSLLFSYDPI